jgi:anti-anti-sigma factor
MHFDFKGNDATVSIGGDFTFTDHTAFLEIMTRLLGITGQPLIIDLSQMDFIDSAGLGMLLIARDEAGKANQQLTLRGPKGQVKRMFAVTKFEGLFTIEA